MQTLDTLDPNTTVKRPATLAVVRATMAESGIRSLYTGLSASLMRQMSYSLVRFGSYEKLKRRIATKKKPTTVQLLFVAGVAGGLGGLVGNPAGETALPDSSGLKLLTRSLMTDILLVRMTSDAIRPPDQRYAYRNAFSGFVSLIKEEGLWGLTRGLGTNSAS
jgi:dicarboxylate transporter 10